MKSRIKTFAIFLFFVFNPVTLVLAQIRSDFVLVPMGETPHLKHDGNSRIHATWSSDGSVHYGLFDTLGNEINIPKKISEIRATLFPRLAFNENNIVVVWRLVSSSFNSFIVGQLISQTGDTVFSNTLFHNPSGDTQRFNPDVAFLNDSSFIAVWTAGAGSGTDSGIYGQMVSASNQMIETNKLLSDTHGVGIIHGVSRVAQNKTSGQFLVVWQDNRSGNSQVFGRLFFSNGQPVDNSFLISEDQELTNVAFLSVSVGSNEGFAVVWGGEINNRWTIQLRYLHQNGLPKGTTTQVNSDLDNVKSFPFVDVSYDINGTSVVVWEGKQNGSSRIAAQRFLQDGSPFGKNFFVSTAGDTLPQLFPNATLHNKKIYFAWGSGEKIWASIYDFNDLTVSVKDRATNVENDFYLLRNYPNPFNSTTIISFTLPIQTFLKLIIYDINGNEIVTLVNNDMQEGNHQIRWNGKNARGDKVSSGVYLYRLINEEFTATRKMLLVQ